MKTAIIRVGILASILGVALAASPASAGLCQVLSSTFQEKKTCGLASRGYGRGYIFGSLRALVALSTANPSGAASVGVRGVRANGTLTTCFIIDQVEDGFDEDEHGAWVSGGQCQQAVKFWTQVNF